LCEFSFLGVLLTPLRTQLLQLSVLMHVYVCCKEVKMHYSW